MSVCKSIVLSLFCFNHPGYLGFIVQKFPLEQTSVCLTASEEVPPIWTDQALSHLEKMLGEVVIVGFTLHIRIIEHSDGADLITHYYYGLSQHFPDLRNPVVLRVLMPNPFHLGVRSETFTKPLEVKGRCCVCLNRSISFYFIQSYFTNIVFTK